MPLADAAISRSEADWLVGINATRALTAFNSQGGGFQKTTSGRVQTPTLAILVEREEKIRAVQAARLFRGFGRLSAWPRATTAGAGSIRLSRRAREEDARAERIWEREKAEAIKAKCEGKPGTIEEEKKPASQAPPLLYDLTTLQREANQRHGFPGADDAADRAGALREAQGAHLSADRFALPAGGSPRHREAA